MSARPVGVAGGQGEELRDLTAGGRRDTDDEVSGESTCRAASPVPGSERRREPILVGRARPPVLEGVGRPDVQTHGRPSLPTAARIMAPDCPARRLVDPAHVQLERPYQEGHRR